MLGLKALMKMNNYIVEFGVSKFCIVKYLVYVCASVFVCLCVCVLDDRLPCRTVHLFSV